MTLGVIPDAFVDDVLREGLFFGVVDKGGNTVDDVEIGYGGGNGVFSSICVLLAYESGMKLLEVE